MRITEKCTDEEPIVYIVDDDEGIRTSLSFFMSSVGQKHVCYESAIDFLDSYNPASTGCLVLDIRMPKMSGMDLQQVLNEQQSSLPIIFITGHGDIPMAVEAIRQGALDFICKPVDGDELLKQVNKALKLNSHSNHKKKITSKAKDKVATLSAREHEVFNLVAAGQTNKSIGIQLHISERTVEVHRAQVMKKLGVVTLPDLVRCKIESEQT